MILPPSPLIILFAALPILAVLAVLALFPTIPRSRFLAVVWTILLALLFGMWVWVNFLAPDELEFWKPPLWYPAIILTAYIILPFGTSYLLRHRRRNGTSVLTAGASALVVLFVCVFSWAVMRFLQQTCVFYDYHHDVGQAWCPPSWQALEGVF